MTSPKERSFHPPLGDYRGSKSLMDDHHKISVTVITGFLGAGKTTFINALLKANPDKQFALVENEFGDVSIDSKLIKGVDASQMFELKEGCICCTISDEYELVLAEMAERFPNIEHLLIETTGVADPASVIRPFFSDGNLQKMYSFNGTICLVDASNFKNNIEKELKIKQIAIADQVLITKAENHSKSEKEDLIILIQQINPLSKIQFSENGFSNQFELESLNYRIRYFPDQEVNHSTITTKLISFSEPLNKEKFANWLSYTLDIYKSKIYRIKGILCFENEPYEFIIQGVGGSFEITEAENLVSGSKSEIVLIGLLGNLNLEVSF